MARPMCLPCLGLLETFRGTSLPSLMRVLKKETGKIVQLSKTVAALSKDLDLIPDTHMEAHKRISNSRSRRSDALCWRL